MTNFILLLGRLTKDPEKRVSKSGKSVTTFSLAISGRKKENGDIPVTFFDCETWEKLADTSATYLHKGDLVQVNGELIRRVYMDSTNAKRDYFSVKVNGIEFLTPKQKKTEEAKDTKIVDEDLPF
nr:MAG TPA: Single strand binding protein [Caudoviricetes sp.]